MTESGFEKRTSEAFGTAFDVSPMIRRLSTVLLVSLAALGFVQPVAAHTGTTHGGTPHWLLLTGAFVGVLGILLGGYRYRHSRSLRAGGVLSAGAIITVLSGIGLVELQIVGTAPPTLTEYYEPASILIGILVMVGSLSIGRFKWPNRPEYAFLGITLGLWILYPAVFPNDGITSIFGYLLVVSVPALTALILWQDARGTLQSLGVQGTSLRVGVGAAVLFAVFLAFSTGSMTLNPDNGKNLPTEPLVTTMPVADPLVVWPAVEWVFPSIPFAGYLSVGTLLFFGFLASLMGLNVAVIHQQWSAMRTGNASGSFLGMLTATGATACCCCAPALYGAVSVLLGASATPLYWAFMDSSSPLSSGFFALTVVLLTRSLIQAGGRSAARARPNQPNAG